MKLEKPERVEPGQVWTSSDVAKMIAFLRKFIVTGFNPNDGEPAWDMKSEDGQAEYWVTEEALMEDPKWVFLHRKTA